MKIKTMDVVVLKEWFKAVENIYRDDPIKRAELVLARIKFDLKNLEREGTR